jgi:spore coat polysaccharide biosynthesis predicted glycosyltransferase SpsG/RimJ/RimL family protein N-acetyltransferase
MLVQDFKIVFVLKTVSDIHLNELSASGFETIVINHENEWIEDLVSNDLVVLDGYDFDELIDKQIRSKNVKLVCIDDIASRPFEADLIINHAPGISKSDYKTPAYTDFALGPAFALLRPVFQSMARNREANLSNRDGSVFICFGGSDYYNCTLQAVQAVVMECPDKEINIVIGASYLYRDILNAFLNDKQGVNVFFNIGENQIADLLCKCSIAIVSASGILYEAVSIRPLIISGFYADNQRRLFDGFYKIGAIDVPTELTYEKFRVAIKEAIKIEKDRLLNRQGIIDGYAPLRFKDKFFQLGLLLRRATLDDLLLLFNWANDTVVRQNAINQELIEMDNHRHWLVDKLRSSNTLIFILTLFDQPIGQIRYDFNGVEWELDYSIDTKYRGRGFGKKIIEMTIKAFSGKVIRAYVKSDNIASSKVFESLQFEKDIAINKNEIILNNYFKFQS